MQQLDNSPDCNSDKGFVFANIDFVVADKLVEEVVVVEVVVFVVVVEWVE